MVKVIKTRIFPLLLVPLLASGFIGDFYSWSSIGNASNLGDYDPLVDIFVTVQIDGVRALDVIDEDSPPDFSVKVSINGIIFISPIRYDTEFLYAPGWSATLDVPDSVDYVAVEIELWDNNNGEDVLCDISSYSPDNPRCCTVQLLYNILTGRWTGDDHFSDPSGYGRLNGCDDGSISSEEKDCELWFSIYQNDYDADGLPYWIETHEYGTDPLVDDRGADLDGDGIPIEWEHKWGFNPLQWDDHGHSDPDNDSIANSEEYLTEGYGSDPFRSDLFLELDFMNDDSNSTVNVVSDRALELLKNPFHERNIVFSIARDEILTFDDFTDQNELLDIYQKYFIQGIINNWRRGVFHYGIFVHDCFPTGYSYAGDGPGFWGYVPGTNSFIVSNTQMKMYDKLRPDITLDYFHASVIMHEIGHHFGIKFGSPPGCDNHFGKYPWQIAYWIYGNYKSIMNYRYTYTILDYSDGSHGKRDFDDWSYIDLTYFEKPPYQ